MKLEFWLLQLRIRYAANATILKFVLFTFDIVTSYVEDTQSKHWQLILYNLVVQINNDHIDIKSFAMLLIELCFSISQMELQTKAFIFILFDLCYLFPNYEDKHKWDTFFLNLTAALNFELEVTFWRASFIYLFE